MPPDRSSLGPRITTVLELEARLALNGLGPLEAGVTTCCKVQHANFIVRKLYSLALPYARGIASRRRPDALCPISRMARAARKPEAAP